MMLTREIAFGMNILTLGGLLLMAVGLNLARATRARLPFGIALMSVGTALVAAGLYVGVRPS